MIKAAIFDLDGVLLDSMGIWRDLGARYLRRNHRIPEDHLNDILYHMSMEQGAEYLRTHYDLPQSREEIEQGLKQMLADFYYYEVDRKPGSLEMLTSLVDVGIPMVLATSSPRNHVEHALKRLGMLEHFQKIFTTGELDTSKHEPLIYQLAARELGTSPEETLVFEDTMYALMTAKEAGFPVVGVCDSYCLTPQEELRAQANYYVTDLREALALVQRNTKP